MPLTSILHILDVLHIVVYLEKLFSCVGALVPSLSYILLLLVWFDDFFYCPHLSGCLRIWAVVFLYFFVLEFFIYSLKIKNSAF
jgi:hypothetical protein